jgi:hypothetical protein
MFFAKKARPEIFQALLLYYVTFGDYHLATRFLAF